MKKRLVLSIVFICVLTLSFSGFSYAADNTAAEESEVVEQGSDYWQETDETEPVTEPETEPVTEPTTEPEPYTDEEMTDMQPGDSGFQLEGRPSQTITTEKKCYDGIVHETSILRASAPGKITFRSSNKKIVKIGKRSGKISYLKKGKVTITIRAAATKEYAATTKTIKVTSFPKKLKKCKVTITKLGKTRVTLSWKKVPYARAYRLIKYNLAKKEYEFVALYDVSARSATITRNAGRYAIRPIALVHGKTILAKKLCPVKIKSLAVHAKTYKKAKNIRKYTPKNLELVANLRGVKGAHVPQSLCFTGDRYIISFVNKEGTQGHLVSYSRKGKLLDEGPLVKMGHANGTTYDPNKERIYTVKTHSNIQSKVCTKLSPNTLGKTGTFNLPKVTSGIAYDESNNCYYLSKGNEIYVTDSKFRYKKTIQKTIRSYHAQDIGAYNGVALVCTWVNGDTSYVDLYRIKDGAYLGSYTFFFNEIESVAVDDGYLVVIMNHIGDNIDYLYRTKERITVNL